MSSRQSPLELTYIKAVNQALHWALHQYPEALAFGEDVAIPGGPFGATRGLREEFGEREVQRPRPDLDRTQRPLVDILHDPVRVCLLVGQGQQDVEDHRGHPERCIVCFGHPAQLVQ